MLQFEKFIDKGVYWTQIDGNLWQAVSQFQVKLYYYVNGVFILYDPAPIYEIY